jgi:hypothetical protein
MLWWYLAVGVPLCLLVGYVVFWAVGLPCRRDEIPFIKAWLRGVSRDDHRWLRAFSDGTISCRATDLAARYANHGEPFIVVNLDHFGGPMDGLLITRRLRRLISLTARREGMPVWPIPHTPWRRAVPISPEAKFHLVQRRGRECVFTKTSPAYTVRQPDPNSKSDHPSGYGQLFITTRYPEKTVYFLSGFDHNELPALYFLTQLPRPVASIKDARDALKPLSVTLAEDAGRKVYRQGDLFAMATKMTEEQIIAQGGVIKPKGCSLYGTAHTADWVASLPDGTQLARGKLYHRPGIIGARRDPDHAPRPLKRRRWHLIAKNTTPMRPPFQETW